MLDSSRFVNKSPSITKIGFLAKQKLHLLVPGYINVMEKTLKLSTIIPLQIHKLVYDYYLDANDRLPFTNNVNIRLV